MKLSKGLKIAIGVVIAAFVAFAIAGKLAAIHIGLIFGIIAFGYQAYLASKSNSTTQTPDGIIDNTGNVKWYKTGHGIFAIALAVVEIAVIIAIASEA